MAGVPITLTQAQKDGLAKLGITAIDWQTVLAFLQKLGSAAGPIAQAILAVISIFASASTPAATKTAALKALQKACPSPSDGCGCCQACLENTLLAAQSCAESSFDKNCDTKQCCADTLGYLLTAVECCASHCNC